MSQHRNVHQLIAPVKLPSGRNRSVIWKGIVPQLSREGTDVNPGAGAESRVTNDAGIRLDPASALGRGTDIPHATAQWRVLKK